MPLLPETADSALDHPTLRVSQRSARELEEIWPESGREPGWVARQGDGEFLQIEHRGGDEVLFGYGRRATFRLHSELECLDCAPVEAGRSWQRILLGKVVPAISVMRGYEALHAVAVESPSGGVVGIMAPSGSGKSTLAATLLRSGWRLFADDQLTLSEDAAGSLWAHPGTPHLTLALDSPAIDDVEELGRTLEVFGAERWLAVNAHADHSAEVRALVLLERSGEAELAFEPLTPNPLVLAPFMLGFESAPARRSRRFELFANLVDSTPLFRLSAGLDRTPHEIARTIEWGLAPMATLAQGGGDGL